MTLAHVISTGRGRLRWRLAIEGLEVEVVSSRAMELTSADGRVRVDGLDPRSIRFGARADVARATLDGDGCTVRCADVRGALSLALSRRPSITTYLGTSLSDSATTIVGVVDTSLFASSGVLHLGTECIAYTGKTATTFTGCTRGYRDTVAQAHFAANGAGLLLPKISDIQDGAEGRRARLYAYGDGDSAVGDGTLVWTGIVAKGPRYSLGERGAEWTIALDPMTRLLSQKIGGDLSEPVPIRGIYYSYYAPLAFLLAIGDVGAHVGLMGFYETQEDFCAELTTRIATAITEAQSRGWSWSTDSQIIAQATPSGWDLVYYVGSGAGTAASVRIGYRASRLDDFGTMEWMEDDGRGLDGMPRLGYAFEKGRVYRMPIRAEFPRAVLGWSSIGGYPYAETDTASDRRLYLGGVIVPSSGMDLSFEGPGIAEGTRSIATHGVDVTARWVEVSGVRNTILGPDTRITIGRSLLAVGDIRSLVAYLVTTSPTLANSGAMPLITSSDLSVSTNVTDELFASRVSGERNFSVFDEVELGELIAPECVASGCILRLDYYGGLEITRLRYVTDSDAADWTIGESDIVGWPELEQNAGGMIGTVVYKTGYDPKEGEWNGPSFRMRDVSALSSNRVAGELEIAQHSSPRVRPSEPPEVTIAEVARAAFPIFGLFGTVYDAITVTVGARYFHARIGDVVSITSSKIMSREGTRGVTGEIAYVSAASFDASTGLVSLELLRSGERFAGYAPDFKITAQSGASTSWTVTVDLNTYSDTADISAWLAVGDAIMIRQRDSASPTTVLGVVASLPASDQIAVTLSSAWTPSTSEWGIQIDDSSAHDSTSAPARFAFVGSATAAITYNDVTKPARVWSP